MGSLSDESTPFLQGTCSVVVVGGPQSPRSAASPEGQHAVPTPRRRAIVVMDIGPDTHTELPHPSVVWNRSPVLALVCLLSLVSVQFSAEMSPFLWSVPGCFGSFAMLVGGLLATCTCCTTRNITIQALSLLIAGNLALVCDVLSLLAALGIGIWLEWMPDRSTVLFMSGLYLVHAVLCCLLIRHAYYAKRILAPSPHGCPAV